MLPYDMFDVTRSANEARRAEKLANIYHKGQSLAWNGREVLSALIKKHGGVHLPDKERKALSRIFSILMWGELAAWRISAQLADRLVPLEAKMAATSQAHDEARHFYVLHDYLKELGEIPARPDPDTEAVLSLVLKTNSLAEKLFGMQILVENIALTIFHFIRRLQVEPVLTELLAYYEKDEARHVGLGLQELPNQMKRMTPRQRASLIAFQVRIVSHIIKGLKALEPDLNTLGVSARTVLEDGTAKVDQTADQMLAELGLSTTVSREVIRRTVQAMCEFLFPREEALWGEKLGSALRILRYGVNSHPTQATLQ